MKYAKVITNLQIELKITRKLQIWDNLWSMEQIRYQASRSRMKDEQTKNKVSEDKRKTAFKVRFFSFKITKISLMNFKKIQTDI